MRNTTRGRYANPLILEIDQSTDVAELTNVSRFSVYRFSCTVLSLQYRAPVDPVFVVFGLNPQPVCGYTRRG